MVQNNIQSLDCSVCQVLCKSDIYENVVVFAFADLFTGLATGRIGVTGPPTTLV